MIHHNGRHDNHGMLPHWARVVFLHFSARLTGMSKYITSDDIHELRLNPSYLSMVDDNDAGSLQNLISLRSQSPREKPLKSKVRRNTIAVMNNLPYRFKSSSDSLEDKDSDVTIQSWKQYFTNNKSSSNSQKQGSELSVTSKKFSVDQSQSKQTTSKKTTMLAALALEPLTEITSAAVMSEPEPQLSEDSELSPSRQRNCRIESILCNCPSEGAKEEPDSTMQEFGNHEHTIAHKCSSCTSENHPAVKPPGYTSLSDTISAMSDESSSPEQARRRFTDGRMMRLSSVRFEDEDRNNNNAIDAEANASSRKLTDHKARCCDSCAQTEEILTCSCHCCNHSCSTKCTPLWLNYQSAVDRKVCPCKHRKHLKSHLNICPCAAQTSLKQEQNQQRTATDVNNSNLHSISETTSKSLSQNREAVWNNAKKNKFKDSYRTSAENDPFIEVRSGLDQDLEAKSSLIVKEDCMNTNPEKLMFNMCKRLNEFKNRLINEDIDAEVKCEWQQVAMVLDRLMFFVFTTCTLALLVGMSAVIQQETPKAIVSEHDHYH